MDLLIRKAIDADPILQALENLGVPPMMGGATAFQADVQLLIPTATFDDGDDAPAGHTGVIIEPSTSWLFRLVVGTTWTGTSPTLDVGIDFNDNALAGTWRQAMDLPQISETDAETNGQAVYYFMATCGYTAAGATTCGMRARTTAAGTTPNLGTVGIEAMGLDLPSNYPTGIIGYNPQILPTRRLQ